ncbi:hypothetical protein SOPP22_01000 [Shewanella sp. OPT22]|nr:hypothetical protein SOPP22_01000 [Shewanella sp. OPT22]
MNYVVKPYWLWLLLFIPFIGLAKGSLETEQNIFSESLSDDWDDDWQDEEDESNLNYFGFVEGAYGRRLQNNTVIHSTSTLNEIRSRLELNYQLTDLNFNVSGDLLDDNIIGETKVQLRTAFIDYNLGNSLNIKAGRQILTWGTGDYLFLNDLFPKDWQSFFSGRADEYLKAPSDSIKTSWYSNNSSIQLVWTPRFEADNSINGERFSYFSPITNQHLGSLPESEKQSSDTWSIKLATSANSIDYALYVHKGFWTTPVGLTPDFKPYYPKLNVYGASIQTPASSGLFNAEVAWYNSVEDSNGSDPFVPNSQFRALIGYEREIIANVTFSAQYYLEHTKNHQHSLENSLASEFEPDQNRQVATLRLRLLTLQNKLNLSLFSFWSPTDRDAYFKPSLSYRYSDDWSFSAGLNVFTGSAQSSFFGQHRDNSNAWLRVRYSY